jgi:hypothetical protein
MNAILQSRLATPVMEVRLPQTWRMGYRWVVGRALFRPIPLKAGKPGEVEMVIAAKSQGTI